MIRHTMIRRPLTFSLLSLVVVGLYLGAAASRGHTGFPLDDGWIHQTYARNWAATGQLAYVPGQPSAGSTAPLWTLLISFAYRLQIDPLVWAYTLGAASLALTAWLAQRLAARLVPQRPAAAWAAGVVVALDWHLIWAAASGMETVLFCALALLVIDQVQARSSSGLIGVCGGLLILTRPEGGILIGLAAIVLLARSDRGGWQDAIKLTIALLITVAPGLWLNWQAGGALFPNTFYAKQSEYAVLTSSAAIWLSAIAEMLMAPLAGGLFLLLLGAIAWCVAHARDVRQRAAWSLWLPPVWIFAHTAVYALRLPVNYQHGRYLIPIIPVLAIYGVAGVARLLDHRATRGRGGRVLGRVWVISIALIVIGYVPLGAAAYTTDVSIIDDEMVAVAHWLTLNTAPNAVIAAHDIGAIGYFARRPLLDLAGLISPEVIPFIQDEARLLDWVRARGAQYLVTFPGWYPDLVRASNWERVFEGDSTVSPEHLTVYAVR
jgi:hypothetical protein